jgi:hypothetical protein
MGTSLVTTAEGTDGREFHSFGAARPFHFPGDRSLVAPFTKHIT